MNGLFLGAFAHADDIRSSAANFEDSAEQVATVDRFTSSKCLKLAPEKCSLLSTNNNNPSTDFSIRIGETGLPMEKSVKCLGVWWDSSSSSKLSIRERINKARSAFFSHGQLGAFQGLLNPLSSRSIVECCVLPVLMYGSESWVLNSTLLSSLESFQSELGKRILKLPKHTSNSIPLLVLNWPSMGGRILCNKLSFLIRSSQDQCDSLKSQVFNSLAASDVMSMSIVKQCKFLVEKLGSDFTNEALSQPQTSQRKLKERIIQFDMKRTLMLSEGHPSLEFVFRGSKKKYLDKVLGHGSRPW